MKHLISLLCVLCLISCSSLKQEKLVEKSVSQMAFGYLESAQKMHRAELYSESIALYSKASRLFLSKLFYKEFSLSQLKKSLLLIKTKKFKSSQETIDFITFCNSKFRLNLESEIKSVQLRQYMAINKTELALKELDFLLANSKSDLEKMAYYKSILLRMKPSAQVRLGLKKEFSSMFVEYQRGAIKNNESFVYVGQSILEGSASFDREVFDKLSIIATDLEIKSLSRFLLVYQQKFSSSEEKPKFQKLINLIEQD